MGVFNKQINKNKQNKTASFIDINPLSTPHNIYVKTLSTNDDYMFHFNNIIEEWGNNINLSDKVLTILGINNFNDWIKNSIKDIHIDKKTDEYIICDKKNENILLDKNYIQEKRISFEEIQKNILKGIAEIIYEKDNNNILDYDFKNWNQDYKKITKEINSSDFITNPEEGYKELFSFYWNSPKGLRNFKVNEFPENILKAIGAE